MNRLMMMLLARQGLMDVAGEGGEGGGGDAGTALSGDAAKTAADAADAKATADAKAAADAEAAAKAAQGADPGKTLSDSEAALLKDVMKWKDKARSAEDTLTTLKTKVGELDQLKGVLGDLDVEAVKALIDKKKTDERTELEKKGEYERVVQQMRDENDQVVNGLKATNSTLQEQINAQNAKIEELTIGRLFRDSTYVQTNSALPPSLAQKEFGAHFETEDGVPVAYDKPRGAATRTKLVDRDGNPKAFDEAIAQLYDKHPEREHLIKATVKPGAGSGTATTRKGGEATNLRGLARINAALDKKRG